MKKVILMKKSFVLEGLHFGYVTEYYDSNTRKWKQVESYNIQEEKNIPPLVVTSNRIKDGKHIYTADCKTEGSYDWVNILSDYAPIDKVSFEDLKYVVEALKISSKFNRPVYSFWSGKTFRPALVTNANNFLIRESHDVEDIVSKLKENGAESICTFGQNSILFDFELPE
jgi:hypothetical protein